MKKMKLRQNNGITLIALVITIIVLLILAGIAISMLAGDNGILKQAAKAKEQTNYSTMVEQIDLIILSVMNSDRSIEWNKLDTELRDLGYKGKKITSFPADIEINENHYAISADGKAKIAEWYYNKEGNITNGKKTLNIGDKILYHSNEDEKGETYTEENMIDNVTKYQSPQLKTGYGNTNAYQEFKASSYNGEWGILGVEDGQILIIPMENIKVSTNGNYYLRGKDGCTNVIDELDKISQVYAHGKGASGARSIKLEDIDRITGYDPNNIDGKGKKHGQGNLGEYENEITYYWQGTDQPYYNATNGTEGTLTTTHNKGFDWWDGKKWNHSEKDDTSNTTNKKKITTLKNDYYYYNVSNYIKNKGVNEENLKKMLFEGENYWLATRYISTGPNYIAFGVRSIRGDEVTFKDLFFSYYVERSLEGGVRPVVSLKSDVEIDGNSTSGWTIK